MPTTVNESDLNDNKNTEEKVEKLTDKSPEQIEQMLDTLGELDNMSPDDVQKLLNREENKKPAVEEVRRGNAEIETDDGTKVINIDAKDKSNTSVDDALEDIAIDFQNAGDLGSAPTSSAEISSTQQQR